MAPSERRYEWLFPDEISPQTLDYLTRSYHAWLASRAHSELTSKDLEVFWENHGRSYNLLSYAKHSLVLDLHELIVPSGDKVHFAPAEFRFVEILMKNSPQPVEYKQIADQMWPGQAIEARAASISMKYHATKIRRKLEQAGDFDEDTLAVQYVRSVGYRIVSRGDLAKNHKQS